MKIIIDDGLSSLNGAAGIGNYSTVLYNGLGELYSDKAHISLRQHAFISSFSNHIRRLLYIFSITVIDQVNNPGIVHFTNYYIPLMKFGKGKHVVTIHDMGAWIHPYGFSKTYLRFIKYMIKKAVAASDLIIAPSETTKKDICNITKISKDKVQVCYNPLKTIWRPIKDYPKGGYLLFVGSIDIHKNLITLVEAFIRLKAHSQYQNMKLVIVGKKRSGYKELDIAIKKNFIEDAVRILGYVNDEELLELYNGAEVLVMPSLYEGFGIPIIEAMACNIPVILSDIPVFKEIAQDAAVFYGTPTNSTLLLAALKKVLSSSTLREKLKQKAAKFLKFYSKKKFIERHMAAYKKLYLK